MDGAAVWQEANAGPCTFSWLGVTQSSLSILIKMICLALRFRAPTRRLPKVDCTEVPTCDRALKSCTMVGGRQGELYKGDFAPNPRIFSSVGV